MIYFITKEDILAQVPESFDASRVNLIRFYSDYALQANCDITSEQIEDHFVSTIDMSQFNADVAITVTEYDDNQQLLDEQKFGIYYDSYDYQRLEAWLNLQQLGYLVPVLKKLSWFKMKEAAQIARKLSSMQGTEYALKAILDLLEANSGITLMRLWQNINDKSYDDMHSVALYDRGFKPTNEMMLRYNIDKLDSWSMEVKHAVASLMLSLPEIASCIQQVIPATLRLTSWQIAQISLALIASVHTYQETNVMHMLSSTGCTLQMQTVCQLVKASLVRNLVSKQFIRVASANEVAARSGWMCTIRLDSNVAVNDATVWIDNKLFAMHVSFDSTTLLVIDSTIDCISAGQHTLRLTYTDESCICTTFEQAFEILSDCSALQVYRLAEIEDLQHLTPMQIHEVGAVRLAVQFTEQMLKTFGRQSVLVPKAYAQFYINTEWCGGKLTINNGVESRTIDIDLQSLLQLSNFTCYVDNIVVNGEEQTCFVLMTKQFVGMYDYTMFANFEGETYDIPLHMVYVAGDVNPIIRFSTIRYLVDAWSNNGLVINPTIDGEQIAACWNLFDLPDTHVKDAWSDYVKLSLINKKDTVTNYVNQITTVFELYADDILGNIIEFKRDNATTTVDCTSYTNIGQVLGALQQLGWFKVDIVDDSLRLQIFDKSLIQYRVVDAEQTDVLPWMQGEEYDDQANDIIASISKTAPSIRFEFDISMYVDPANPVDTVIRHIVLEDVLRQPSYILQNVDIFKSSTVYVAAKHGCIFDLYYKQNDKYIKIQSANDSIVFAMMHSGNYRLTCKSKLYNKQIDIEV